MSKKFLYFIFAFLTFTVTIGNNLFDGNSSKVYFEREEFKKPALEALSYYPELNNIKIRFIDAGKSKIAHRAAPRAFSLFRRSKKRVYLVKIASDQYGELDSTLFKNLSYKAKVGVLGHELAHIYDYVDESSLKLIGKGIKYTTKKKYKQQYELETNMEAISRGLGENILSWSNQVHSYLERDGRGNMYHSPSEIVSILDSLNNAN